MNNIQRIASWLLVMAVFATAESKLFEAVIQYPSGTTGHVTIESKSYFDAQDQIKARYCGGQDCIVEGPWEKH